MFNHSPVLIKEVLEYLNPSEGDVIFDGTIGGGGYYSAIKAKCDDIDYIGVDQDQFALDYIKDQYDSDRLSLIHDSFFNFEKIVQRDNIKVPNKIVLDLGVSSVQIDTPERGFSYSKDGPLDMRMNQSSDLTAFRVLNQYSERDIADVIFNFGEEPKSRQIAKAIYDYRRKQKIETTKELSSVISKVIHGSYGRRMTALKRVFQALRIEVNNELHGLEEVLPKMISLLPGGGRIVIVTFHSLEDRIVKQVFKKADSFSDNFVLQLCKKAVKPSYKEIKKNKRASSAILRAIAKK